MEKNEIVVKTDLAFIVFMLICMLTCGKPDVIDGVTHQLMTKCEPPAVEVER